MTAESTPTVMTLMCYNDTHGYGWRHVDLFVHDEEGRELNWVHWQSPADGPDAADEVTSHVEPSLRRVSEWRHAVSASGMDYWEADAAWGPVEDPDPQADPRPDALAGRGGVAT